jgi:hypothetical protein
MRLTKSHDESREDDKTPRMLFKSGMKSLIAEAVFNPFWGGLLSTTGVN